MDSAKHYRTRKGALWSERESWISHWRELSDHLSPRTGRFFRQDRNKGQKRHSKIIDSTGTRAVRVCAAGLMAGMTSPARPWFRLETADKELMQSTDVKKWVNFCTELMRTIFARSNTYRSLHSMYEELITYGTAASIVLPDYHDVVRHYTLTAGEYAISTDHRGVVDTLYREFDMTVAQIVGEFVYDAQTQKFNWDAVSPQVKNLWDNHGKDTWRPILHCIEPRKNRNPDSYLSSDLPFASCYLETGGDNDKFMRESGFKTFPALCPRWHVAGGDIYGNSPAMEALGDVKQLQHQQSRKALGIDYMVKPPLRVPTALQNQPLSILPGGVAYADGADSIKSMFDVRLDLSHLQKDIADVQQRLNSTMYVDLFLMLVQDDRSGITAREVTELHEEKLLMLGPVLERLHNELLKPFIDHVFEMIIDNEMAPPPPEELQGMDLNVEFVSTLAQAQRAVGVSSIDRLIGTVGQMSQFVPAVLDKLNSDEIVDQYAEMLGVDPNLIIGDDEVVAVRQKRAEAQAAQQQAVATQEAAKTAETMGKVDPNNLRDVMSQFSGYTSQL